MTSDEAEAGQPVENWHVHYRGCPSCALLQDEARAELRAKLAAKVRAIKDSEITAEVNAQGAAGYAIGRDEARKRLTLRRLIEGSDPASRSWPGRAEMEAMTNAEVNDFLESRGLDVRVIEGSDPASPITDPYAGHDGSDEPVSGMGVTEGFVANLRQQVAIGADTQTREAVVHMLDKIAAALVGNESAIEGSDPASPPCKECGEAQAAPQHDPETILDPGTVGHEVHVYFPVREGSDPASPEQEATDG